MDHTAQALCQALREDQLPATLTPELWDAVATLAVRQRVGPLLLHRTSHHLPPAVRDRLRTRVDQSVKRSLLQQGAFRTLADAVEGHGITLVALKGLHLGTAVYSQAWMREMNDIDVMVRPHQVETLASILRDRGFTPVEDVPVAIALVKMHHLPRLVKAYAGVEIHWRLSPPGRPPIEDTSGVWSRVVPSRLAPNAAVLSPEDALIHVCAHAVESHYLEQGLRTLCDVQAMVTKWHDVLQWDVVAERARAWQCARSVALVLHLAHRHLGAPVPSHLFELWPDTTPSAEVLEIAMNQVFDNATGAGMVSEAAGRLFTLPYRARLRLVLDRIRMKPGDESPGAQGPQGWAKYRFLARRTFDLTRWYRSRLAQAALHKQSPMRLALDRRNTLVDWVRQKH